MGKLEYNIYILMDQILFCIHDKCNAQSRLLLTMADVPKHTDKIHKVV